MNVVGLQLRVQECGPDVYPLGLKWALTMVGLPPIPVGFAAVCQ
ncbi:MAG: hypothetical protein N0A00_01970 [Candidatus Bathyarchaeota archaeon]|nr:hypothetical protein [Candidatus Bathyarchaeota archaeon]